MAKWKDTVLKADQVIAKMIALIREVIRSKEDFLRMPKKEAVARLLKRELEAQAEISFKAGKEAGKLENFCMLQRDFALDTGEAGREFREYLNSNTAIAEAKYQGIREVVEWIKTQQLPKEYQAEEYRGLVVIADKFWQAKLKEWGIE